MNPEVSDQLQGLTKCLLDLEKNAAVLTGMLAPAAVGDLQPLERAQALLALGHTITGLYQLRLRAQGINPAEHPAQKEQGRLKLYANKVKKAVASEELRHARPSLSLDIAAANRFIDHSIPDLTADQRRQLRDAGEAMKRRAHEDSSKGSTKKRSKPGSKPAQDAVLAFLDKVKKGAEAD